MNAIDPNDSLARFLAFARASGVEWEWISVIDYGERKGMLRITVLPEWMIRMAGAAVIETASKVSWCDDLRIEVDHDHFTFCSQASEDAWEAVARKWLGNDEERPAPAPPARLFPEDDIPF